MDIPQTYRGRRLRWSWDYRDESGKPIGLKVARFDDADGKDCVPYRLNGSGWEAGAPPEPRPLFGLQTLAPARERGGSLVVVEGEKCAAALHSLGFAAVTSQGGANAAGKADWTPCSGFARVYVLPDNNEPGRRYARDVCAALGALPEPPERFIVDLPGLPPAGDVVDWLRTRLPDWDGFTSIDAELVSGLMDEFKQAIRQHAKPPPPEWSGGAVWPDPEPLPEARPPVLAFDDALLPDALKGWVMDISERMQCPPDYPAAGVLVAAGSVIGRAVGIRPKQRDDWLVVANLWGGNVGPPGVMKTPAMAEALRPLNRLAAEAHEAFQHALRQWTVDKHRRDAERHQTRQAMRKTKDADKLDAMARELADMDRDDDSPPPERRYASNDPTVEKLAELLSANPRGLLVTRDELTGWLRDMDRPGREGSRAFYLEAWNGTGGHTVDRIGRGTIRVEAACVSVLGNIQPGPLASYVYNALSEGSGADGLLQRFQVMVWPDEPLTWRDIDRWPDSKARNTAHEAFAGLAGLDPLTIGAETDDDGGIPFLRFDESAQGLFREWRNDLERRIKSEAHEAMQGHLSKYRKLCPAIALIVHLLDTGRGPVTEAAMLRAAGWCEYLESHARRVYGSSLAPEITAARLLAGRLAGLPDPFKPKDVYDRGWSGLDREQVEMAITELAERGWLRIDRIHTGGRPSVVCVKNPAIGGAV